MDCPLNYHATVEYSAVPQEGKGYRAGKHPLLHVQRLVYQDQSDGVAHSLLQVHRG